MKRNKKKKNPMSAKKENAAKVTIMKGMTGKVLTILLSIIVAIAALIVLYFFFNKSIDFITGMIDKILKGILDWIVEKLPGAIWEGITKTFGKIFKTG